MSDLPHIPINGDSGLWTIEEAGTECCWSRCPAPHLHIGQPVAAADITRLIGNPLNNPPKETSA